MWVKILFNFCGWLDCMNIYFNEILCAIKQSISWHLLGAVQNGALKIYLCVIHSHGDEMSNFLCLLHDFQLIFLLPDNYTLDIESLDTEKWHLWRVICMCMHICCDLSSLCRAQIVTTRCYLYARHFLIYLNCCLQCMHILYHVTQNHFFFARLVCHWHHHFHIYHIPAVPRMQQGVTTLRILIETL